MGFNRRKMEDERRRAAEKEAASRRATDAQVLEDAARLIAAWNERQAKRMADAILADDRRRHRRTLLVFVGVLSGLPDSQCHRLADTRPSPRHCRDESHSGAVLSLMPTECAICRTCAPIANEHCR
jgi:hypothetical protein